MTKDIPAWWVYMVECANGSYYTGSTNDINHRIEQHNNGTGAKYTRSHAPVKLVYFEPHSNRSAAFKREMEIKELNHGQKKELVNGFLP